MTKPPTPEKLAEQLDRLELAGRSPLEVEPSRRLEWAAYQVILAAAGIDPVALEWDGRLYTADDVRERLVAPLSHAWGHLRDNVPDFPPSHQIKHTPVFVLGNALRRLFGITHRIKGKHERQRYAVDVQALELRRNLLAQRRAHATQDDL